MGWQVDEEVNQDKTGEVGGMNLEVDSNDKVMHIWTSDLWYSRRWLAGEKGWQQMKSGYCEGVEDKVVKIASFSACKNFVGKREFIFDAFVDL